MEQQIPPDQQPSHLFENYDGDGDEALSLSDLPITMQIDGDEALVPLQRVEAHDDFDFCALSNMSPEMCAADEVFFQGQILPLRCSIGSADGVTLFHRSRSVDCRDSGGLSASRSTSSYSSSGSSPTDKPPKPPRNLFHSHPSPSPKVQTAAKIHSRNCTAADKSSSAWRIFRLGLLATPPKIVFQDAKSRTNCRNRNTAADNKKKAARGNFLGACDCSLGAVDTVPSKVVVYKRSTSDGENESHAPKKRVSHHRTFEWLKQLSIESEQDVTVGKQP